MVQILPQQQDPLATGLAEAIGSISDVIGKSFQDKRDASAFKEGFGLSEEQAKILSRASPSTKKAFFDERKPVGSAGPKLSPLERETQLKNLLKEGVPREEAEIWVDSTRLVQGAFARNHIDLRQRGLRKRLSDVPTSDQSLNDIEIDSANEKKLRGDDKDPGIEWPEIPLPEGFNNKEIATFKLLNQKTNNPEVKTLREKSLNFKKMETRLGILDSLNDGGNLPSGMGSIIIDTEGNIRPTAQLLGLVNKDTERYAKTLADFISGAKIDFGARVTNFDLASFMKKLPSLLNTPEGRRSMVQQIKLLNELENLHNKGLQDALQHYGNRASFSDISKISDDAIENRESEIIEKINRLTEATDIMDKRSKNPDKFGNTTLMFDEDGFHNVFDDQVETAETTYGLKRW